MTMLIDQVLQVFIARCETVALATGGVFEDRQAVFTKDEANAINVVLKEASCQTLGDNNPARSILQAVLQVDLQVYTRAETDGAGYTVPSRVLASNIWQSAHSALMAEPSLGGLAARVRWVRSAWQAQDADGAAGWASHTYEMRIAMRESDLSAPLQ